MSVVGEYPAFLFVIVLDESRKLEESLLRNYKVIILGTVGHFVPDSEAEAVDSNEVEAAVFDVEELSGEDRLALIERSSVACLGYHRAEKSLLHSKAAL